jgi:hypothetical protein
LPTEGDGGAESSSVAAEISGSVNIKAAKKGAKIFKMGTAIKEKDAKTPQVWVEVFY